MSDGGLRVVPAASHHELTAAYAIMLLAGEHMHRVQGMDHWWPFPSVESFTERFAGRDTVLALRDDVLVATWNTSTTPEPYHDLTVWPEPDAPSLFLSAFAVLPTVWGRGVGRAALRHVAATARSQGLDRVRFDAVAANRRLVAWYEREGFTAVGDLEPRPGVTVTCFERRLQRPPITPRDAP